MIETGCPVRILQGVQDADVPWQHALELSARFARDDVVLTMVKDGDHRLSRPEDIERLIAAAAKFCEFSPQPQSVPPTFPGPTNPLPHGGAAQRGKRRRPR